MSSNSSNKDGKKISYKGDLNVESSGKSKSKALHKMIKGDHPNFNKYHQKNIFK